MEWRVETEEELSLLIPELDAALCGVRKIGLFGPLGAGKTAFVRAFCRYLGVQEAVQSPTFSLINVYNYPTDRGMEKVHHIDLYRLNRLEEALDIGLEELLDTPDYCFIEWPELIEQIFPSNFAKIHIEAVSGNARRLIIL